MGLGVGWVSGRRYHSVARVYTDSILHDYCCEIRGRRSVIIKLGSGRVGPARRYIIMAGVILGDRMSIYSLEIRTASGGICPEYCGVPPV